MVRMMVRETRVDYPFRTDSVKKNKWRNKEIAPSFLAIVEVGETGLEELVWMGSKTVSFDAFRGYGNQP